MVINRTRYTQDGTPINLTAQGWSYIGKFRRAINENLPGRPVTDEYYTLDIDEIPTYPCFYLLTINKEIYFVGIASNGFRDRFSSGPKRITKSEMDSLYGTSPRLNNLINQYGKDHLETDLFLYDISSLKTEREINHKQCDFIEKYNPSGMIRRPVRMP